ncbi:DUF4062 domain-containing protein [Photobacterium kishitanii]|uniref:DUF4062 domain-containing protein n=1 Tax=Photobacterium kishitanii TaxID=318456 RepID=UPI0015E67246|nr:DUF4062 domain-containing protein [Photobacterium kishitanii]
MSEPSVFISSTFVDFIKERDAVAAVLRDLSIKVNAIGIQPASSKSPKDKIIEGIIDADFIILLVGNRYGSILDYYSKDKSVTHWEYMVGRFEKKSFLVYFFKEKNILDEQDERFKHKQTRLKNFKAMLSVKHDVKYVQSIQELEDSVRESIIPMYSEALKNSWNINREKVSELNGIKEELKKLEIMSDSTKKSQLNPMSHNNMNGLLEPSGMATYMSNPFLGLNKKD